jgi:ATP-dependent helicase HrpB
LEAIDSKSIITQHGKEMIRLGLHPRLAHMILISKTIGFQSEAILLAALLSERDPFSKSTYRSADMRERFWLICDFFRNNAVDAQFRQSLSLILTTAHDLATRLGLSLKLSSEISPSMIALLLALAYPDRIAKLRNANGEKYLLSNGKEAILSVEDDLRGEEWLVICESNGNSTAARIQRCAPLDIELLKRECHDLFSDEERVQWNRETQKVEARAVHSLGAIVLESHPIAIADTTMIKQALLEGIRLHGLESLPWSDDALLLLHRLRFFHHHVPADSYGDFDDEILLATLEEWLLPHLSDQTSLRDCATLNLHTILSANLSWNQTQHLNTLLPTHFTAPTGNRIALDYSDSETVVLAVRIQEVFGLSTHPSIMEGKIPLLIHLLSPARRPIQITRDLVGFWNSSYSDVKKELKGRYPKHYWPDDPRNAEATNRTKKYMI